MACLRSITSPAFSWAIKLSAADALNKHAEALAGLTLLPVEEQGPFHHLKHLLLGVDLVHHGAQALALAPQAAHEDAVAYLLLGDTVKPAGIHTLAAVVAGVPVDLHDAVLIQLGGLHRAYIYHRALGAAIAVVGVIGGHLLPHDAEVIEGGLDTVVGAAADSNFELVGQLYIVPALVEFLVELPGQSLGVDEAVDAHGALTGHNGPHPGAGATGVQTGLGNVLVEGLDGVIGKSLDLDGQAGGHGQPAVSELLGGLRGHSKLLAGEHAVHGDETGDKVLPIPGHDVAPAFEGFLLGICDFHTVCSPHMVLSVVTDPGAGY